MLRPSITPSVVPARPGIINLLVKFSAFWIALRVFLACINFWVVLPVLPNIVAPFKPLNAHPANLASPYPASIDATVNPPDCMATGIVFTLNIWSNKLFEPLCCSWVCITSNSDNPLFLASSKLIIVPYLVISLPNLVISLSITEFIKFSNPFRPFTSL